MLNRIKLIQMMQWNSSNQIIALNNSKSPKNIKSLPNMHEIVFINHIHFDSKIVFIKLIYLSCF